MGIGDLVVGIFPDYLAPLHVRVYRTAHDWPRPYDRYLDSKFSEVSRTSAPKHLDLGTALDLEQADRVT